MTKMSKDKERRREHLENSMAALARVLKGLEIVEVCLDHESAMETAKVEVNIIRQKVHLAQNELGNLHQFIKE